MAAVAPLSPRGWARQPSYSNATRQKTAPGRNFSLPRNGLSVIAGHGTLVSGRESKFGSATAYISIAININI